MGCVLLQCCGSSQHRQIIDIEDIPCACTRVRQHRCVIERRLLHFWVLWEATHLWINNLKCFTSKWDGYWSFLMSGELFKCRQTAIRMQNFEIQNKKITPPIAQQNWGFLGWKRQFSSDAGSSAIPGKLSSRNFVKQNLAVQLAVVFLRFRKKHKKLILRLDFTPNLYHKNHF